MSIQKEMEGTLRGSRIMEYYPWATDAEMRRIYRTV